MATGTGCASHLPGSGFPDKEVALKHWSKRGTDLVPASSPPPAPWTEAYGVAQKGRILGTLFLLDGGDAGVRAVAFAPHLGSGSRDFDERFFAASFPELDPEEATAWMYDAQLASATGQLRGTLAAIAADAPDSIPGASFVQRVVGEKTALVIVSEGILVIVGYTADLGSHGLLPTQGGEDAAAPEPSASSESEVLPASSAAADAPVQGPATTSDVGGTATNTIETCTAALAQSKSEDEAMAELDAQERELFFADFREQHPELDERAARQAFTDEYFEVGANGRTYPKKLFMLEYLKNRSRWSKAEEITERKTELARSGLAAIKNCQAAVKQLEDASRRP